MAKTFEVRYLGTLIPQTADAALTAGEVPFADSPLETSFPITIAVTEDGVTPTDVTATPVAGYEFSEDEVTWSATPVAISPVSASRTVYVRQVTAHPDVVDEAFCSFSYIGALEALPDILGPDAITDLTATLDGSDIDLAWTEPADNGGGTVAEYRILRRPVLGEFTLLDTIAAPAAVYTDTAPGEGSWEYNVHAVDAASNEAEASNIPAAVVIEAAGDTTAPVLAGDLSVVGGDGQFTISGKTATDAVGIAKWQRRIDAGAWVDIPASAATTIPETVVSPVPNDVEYSITVRALDAAGNPSDPSEAVLVTPTAAVTYLFQDEHDDTTIDLAKWTTAGTAPALSESGGFLNVSTSGNGGAEVYQNWDESTPVPTGKRLRFEADVIFGTATHSRVGIYVWQDAGNNADFTIGKHSSSGTDIRLCADAQTTVLLTPIDPSHKYHVALDIDLNTGGHTVITIDGVEKLNELTTAFLSRRSSTAGDPAFAQRIGFDHYTAGTAPNTEHKVDYSRISEY